MCSLNDSTLRCHFEHAPNGFCRSRQIENNHATALHHCQPPAGPLIHYVSPARGPGHTQVTSAHEAHRGHTRSRVARSARRTDLYQRLLQLLKGRGVGGRWELSFTARLLVVGRRRRRGSLLRGRHDLTVHGSPSRHLQFDRTLPLHGHGFICPGLLPTADKQFGSRSTCGSPPFRLGARQPLRGRHRRYGAAARHRTEPRPTRADTPDICRQKDVLKVSRRALGDRTIVVKW